MNAWSSADRRAMPSPTASPFGRIFLKAFLAQIALLVVGFLFFVGTGATSGVLSAFGGLVLLLISTPLAVVLLAAAGAAETFLLPPDQSVAGTTQEEWSRLWWQWAASFDHSASPVADQTGELCASKQRGDVWFLAGTFGTRRTVRACTVPRGKYLFFPLINYVVGPRADGSLDCVSVMSTAARMTEQVSNLVLELDGLRQGELVKHRQATRGCFDLGAMAEPKSRIFPSAANGY